MRVDICPSCGGKTDVVDSRPTDMGVRRRRQCFACGERFTTYEKMTIVSDPDVTEALKEAIEINKSELKRLRMLEERITSYVG